MSLEQYLKKYKKEKKIDFIEVERDFGNSYKEFWLYSFDKKRFSRIFYTNKYREDYWENPNSELYSLKKKYELFAPDIETVGLYSTREECKNLQRKIDFIEKYIK